VTASRHRGRRSVLLDCYYSPIFQPHQENGPARWAQDADPGFIHYQHRAEVEAVVQAGTGRDAAFDALAVGVGTVLAADPTLGGLCDWVEADAPRPIDLAVDGAAPLKAAVIPIVLHYASADPLG